MNSNCQPLIAGIDEAGRGALAGPVTVVSVILPNHHPLTTLDDSKRLTPAKREALAVAIKSHALAFHVVHISPDIIDKINILQATLLGMSQSIMGLKILPSEILIDGNQCPVNLPAPARAIIKGDQSEAIISAASILAKTARDHYMCLLHQSYPHYNFQAHKGYGTTEHTSAIFQYGACIHHRKTFEPIKTLLTQSTLF